jgi:hypothetical protein
MHESLLTAAQQQQRQQQQAVRQQQQHRMIEEGCCRASIAAVCAHTAWFWAAYFVNINCIKQMSMTACLAAACSTGVVQRTGLGVKDNRKDENEMKIAIYQIHLCPR